MTWQNRGGSAQRYNYIYDDASRLIRSSYTVGNSSNRYSTQYLYDCMGNITSLKRNGLLDDGNYGLIDDLTLTYDGNQLMAVSDNGEELTYNNAWHFVDGANDLIEYEYDENGNLTKDSNRNILSIQYNSLNLPTVIAFADGKTIKYTYSADGRKLRAVYTTTTPATTKQIDYCGNLIFENGQLKQVLVDGGYIPVDDWSGAYCYYVKEHLGNNRMVVHQSGSVNQVNMDPDGKSPVIGALIGGGLDFAAQVVGGMVSGQSFSEAAAHVNWVSVGTAALAGAAGVGIASRLKQVSNIEKMSKVASISTEVAIDGGAGGIASAGKQAMDNKGKISIKKVASDAFASALGGQAGNKSLRLSRSSSEYKTLQRQADHANRVAKGSTRSSRTQGALKANAKVAKFGQTKAATISAGTSETVSRTSDKLQNR